MVKDLTGSFKIKIHPTKDTEVEIDFTPPFKRIPMIAGLEEKTNSKFPEDLTTPDANKFLDELAKKHEVVCTSPRTT